MNSPMSDPTQFPHTGRKAREQVKREGSNGKPGKAGKVQGKGGATTSHKATGGKMAR
jgi:hypothetical protein